LRIYLVRASRIGRQAAEGEYLQVVASLLPRQVQMEKLTPFADLTDEELRLVDELLTATRDLVYDRK
jgi:hypothetical protein